MCTGQWPTARATHQRRGGAFLCSDACQSEHPAPGNPRRYKRKERDQALVIGEPSGPRRKPMARVVAPGFWRVRVCARGRSCLFYPRCPAQGVLRILAAASTFFNTHALLLSIFILLSGFLAVLNPLPTSTAAFGFSGSPSPR
jgi:hypothetical protein